MDNFKLGSVAILSDYQKYNSRLAGTLERLSTGQKAPTPESNPVLWSEVQQMRQYATSLSAFSDNLNRGAASVRVAMESMDVSRQHLSQLKEALNSAMAAEPGSRERSVHLKNYNELHNFVNDAAKAPDPGARRLLDNPESYPDAGTVRIRAGENGFTLSLRSREIHTGATGLDLPLAGEAVPSALDSDPAASPLIADISAAEDSEILEMLRQLERAQVDLEAKAKALTVDAKAIEDAEGFNTALVNRNNSLADQLDVPDLNAEAVLAQAMTTRSSLALNGLVGLNETHRIALQLLQ